MGRAQFLDIFPKRLENILTFNFSKVDYSNILVTGSGGMLGNAVAVTLDKLIYENSLRCDLFLASRLWQKEELIGFNKSPILLTNTEARSGRYDFDLIIHCASPSNITKIESYTQLADINRGFLEDCISTRTKKVIFISSGEVYWGGPTKVARIQANRVESNIRDWYPLAKIECEEYLFNMKSNSKLSIDILRLFHTFGPGLSRNDGRSFADILYLASDEKAIELKSEGSQVRSFLYLGDAVSAILRCIDDKSEYRVLNVGSPNQLSIMQFAKFVGNATQSDVIVKEKEFNHSPFDCIVPDISETIEWGWTPTVDIHETIILTLNWIKKQKL